MIGDVEGRKLETETDLLAALRADYEARGFSFVTEPGADALPSFLGGFKPDALARAPGRNVAIVVKRRRGPRHGDSVADVRALLADRPDWSFPVVVPASDPLDAVVIRDATPDAVEAQRRDVLALALQGHRRAAFIMAWALLEAASRARDGAARGPARPAGAVVQALAMTGRIEIETERRLRSLLDLRNRIVHGDLLAEPEGGDIDAVLSAVGEVLQVAVA